MLAAIVVFERLSQSAIVFGRVGVAAILFGVFGCKRQPESLGPAMLERDETPGGSDRCIGTGAATAREFGATSSVEQGLLLGP